MTVVFLCVSLIVLAQRNPPAIINYGPEVYGSGNTVYSIAQDQEGILYFGVSSGVLVYDGATWDSYELKNRSEVRSLEYDPKSDRVYVGGVTTFGYLEKSRNTRYHYVSLSDSIFAKQQFREVWQVFVKGDSVLFQSEPGFFIYLGQSMSFMPLAQSYIYSCGNRVYISQKDGALSLLKNQQLVPVWDQADVNHEAANGVIAWNDHEDLVIYPTQGVVTVDYLTGKTKRLSHPLSDLSRERWLYQVLAPGEQLLAAASWQDGVFIIDRATKSTTQFGPAQGLQGFGIYDMELDRDGRLWLALDYGISFINLQQKFQSIDSIQHHTPVRITSLETGAHARQFTIRPHDTITLDRAPSHLQIHFSRPSSDFGKRRFLYKLDGIDHAWKETTTPSAAYLDLPRGAYVFRSTLADENPSAEGTLVILIDPPWYAVFEGGAGIALAVIIALSGLALIIIVRSRQARQTLRRMVEEKTAQIEQTKQELIRSNRVLLETNDELDTFLYRSSHDLVAPVKSIRGLIQLMRMSPHDRDLYMKMMEERILKLEKLLSEINNYIRHTRQQGEAAEFHANELVTSVWSEIEFMDEEHKVKLIKMIDRDTRFSSDVNSWRMILSNLLSNAIKYRDSKKSVQFVKLAIHTADGRAFLTVEDNGVGIPKNSMKHVFDMFYRAHETNSGSGLGLYLVKRMVDRLGGEIRIESEVSRGTSVFISCPLNRPTTPIMELPPSIKAVTE